MHSALLPGLILILIAVTGWMKLVSYAHANKDLREILKAGEQVLFNDFCISSCMDFIIYLEPFVAFFLIHSGCHIGSCKVFWITVNICVIEKSRGLLQPDVPQHAEKIDIPDNLTVQNISYFILAPTLCYQVRLSTLCCSNVIEFPKNIEL